MIKLSKIIIICILLSLIIGCSSAPKNEVIYDSKDYVGNKILTCKNYEQNEKLNYEINTTFEIKSKNNVAIENKVHYEIKSDSDEVLEILSDKLEEKYKESIEEYGGTTMNKTKDKNKLIVDITLDYKKMDIEKYVEIEPLLKQTTKNNEIKTTVMRLIYEKKDYDCELN